MAFGQDRQMFDVDVDCAKCGKHISQLPFQPSGEKPVYCSECIREMRPPRRSGGFGDRGPRRMFQVDVACSGCGKKITELPFVPSGDKPVYCPDCFRANRNG